MIGDFDGKEFKPDTQIIDYNYRDAFYASQTFNNIPEEDGRRIQIGWGRIATPGMPFNQMMNFPVTLTLRTTANGIRLCPMPIREIETLYESEATFEDEKIKPGDNLLSGFKGGLLDIDADIEVSRADRVGFRIGKFEVVYDNNEKKLTCGRDGVEPTYDDLSNKSRAGKEFATLEPSRGHIQLRILVDKTSVEIYANNGEVFMPMGAVSKGGQDKSLELFAEGGTAKIRSLAIRELKSVW